MSVQIIAIISIILLSLITAVVYFYIQKEKYVDNDFFKFLPLDRITRSASSYTQEYRQPTKIENTDKQKFKKSLPENTLFTFEAYIQMIKEIFEMVSSNRKLTNYNFREISKDDVGNHDYYQEQIMATLTNKINELTTEELLVQQPSLLYYKDENNKTILIKYYFTLSNPRRSSSINSLANVVILDEIEIINVHTLDSTLDINNLGYNPIDKTKQRQLNSPIEIPIEDCLPPGLFI